LVVWRRTEWHGGNTTFMGFKVDSGAIVIKPKIPVRKLEFIGDSYTCGYGNEGAMPTEDFQYSTENNYMSYGAITARTLNAQYLAVCRSGIGIIHGYGGMPGFTMPRYYDAVLNDSTIKWDFTRYSPDAVVIVLGGNDLSVALDSRAFVKEYIKFVQRVSKNYPDAQIVCVAGPSDKGSKFNKWRDMIHAAVNETVKSNPNIHYFEFSTFSMHGSDYHPNIAEHTMMAGELTPYLKNLLHW
jgi:lysophospholipase L1-like esterase